MANIFSAIQVLASIALIVLIILQEPASGLGGIFGGSSESFYQKRRGTAQGMFWVTFALTFALGLVSVLLFIYA